MRNETKNSSDLSLFEKIVLVISKNSLILSLQPLISKLFLNHENFFLTVGQDNFGNKIPLPTQFAYKSIKFLAYSLTLLIL